MSFWRRFWREWMVPHYAIVVEIIELFPGDRRRMANTRIPYRVPRGEFAPARRALARQYPDAMIIIADKATLLNNSFDLQESDFDRLLEVEIEPARHYPD